MRKEIKLIINKLKALLKKWFNNYNEHLPYIITSGIALIIVIGAVTVFIELTENLKSEILGQYDSAITQSILLWRSSGLTEYFIFVTHIGGIYGYLVVFSLATFLLFITFKNWHYVFQLSIVMILALSSNVIIKEMVNRSRPDLEHLVMVKTLSYPSGHAMTAMAFYGFIIFLTYQFKINGFLKFVIITVLTTLIISIGLSRIYLGVHFPSDIIGGYIAGFIWVVLCALIFNLIKVFNKDPST
ncbi:phosphatase PAP2 family protein [Bizionia gelidisalsuginis]|uniref:Phosphatase PAP2 family protein n=2 Tax=Bizionia TaxID=283785 RepID=A0A8H2LBS4_9FLAO|nr:MULTISPECIES: phosphatase PAP2 family protein [Bizionia]TYB71818.1 phosphatase PAP2 family protein [Bizionia saleffrena]TYC09583.1 phosphatase PAP2 family protein [Bizionia gelidisalsuginis]